jgi:hypothetical protein
MSLIRVMHISLGRPLISAEHDPHFPALQFHLKAKSLACSACIWSTASSTTIPSVISVWYSLNSPPESFVRHMLNVMVGIISSVYMNLPYSLLSPGVKEAWLISFR